jgi:UDP-N-acetylmuramoyl-tripeptide--D-alanyl-D-alanine ligase
MKFSGLQIAQATRGVLHQGDHVGPLGTDTRALPAGAWFVALAGERFDAHDMLDAALAAGAGGAVLSRQAGWTLPWVEVADTTVALQDLGRCARTRLNGPVVALTGSSGKTTTRALVACALSPMGLVHQTVGNLNNHLGVPLTLCAAPQDAAVTVVEMGTSSPGEIAFLADMATPDVRLVINVGAAHLQELGGLSGVGDEKSALHRSARPGDTCITNADDPHLRDRAVPGRRLSFGVSKDADIRVSDVVVDADAWCTRARFHTPAGVVDAVIPAPGTHIALDAAAALAVAYALEVDLHEAAAALSTYAPVGMRFKPVPLPNGALAINDAYNANPQSMRASLDTLAAMDGRRVAVLGDMLELGEHAEQLHREVGRCVAELSPDSLLAVGLDTERYVVAAAVEAGFDASRVRCFKDAAAASAALKSIFKPGDCVLLKASRGMRLERILDGLQI